MVVTPDQIRAARALKGWGQLELAERAGVSQVTVGNIESRATKGSESSINAIVAALENAGVEFIENGVRLSTHATATLEGKDSPIKLLNDVFYSLCDDSVENKEVLFMGSDERRASPQFIRTMRKLRKSGIQVRSLVAAGYNHCMGPTHEYRELPKDFSTTDVVVIYSTKVAFVLEQRPHYRVLIVRNEHVSEDHRKLFNYLWKIGKQPNPIHQEALYE